MLLGESEEPSAPEITLLEKIFEGPALSTFNASEFKKSSWSTLLTPSLFQTDKRSWYLFTHVEKMPLWLQEAALRDVPYAPLVFIGKASAKLKKFESGVSHQGVLHKLKSSKPWEKANSLMEWLVQEEEKINLKIEPQARKYLVDSVQGESHILQNKLHVLKLYMGDQVDATLNDVKAVIPREQFPLYELSQAIMEKKAVKAVKLSKLFISQGVAIFSLIEMLRNFFTQQHLKKRINVDRLSQALLNIHSIEKIAKDSSISHNNLIETLILKLIIL